jgi:D-alanine transfer protein
MKKNTMLKAVLPMILAFAVVIGILVVNNKPVATEENNHTTFTDWEWKNSLPTGTQLFDNPSVATKLLSNKNAVPFLGSSELSRTDPFHPSSLAMKYKRGYLPVMVGTPGSTSMAQMLFIKDNQSVMKNRKVVFIISPQWFTAEGTTDAEISKVLTNRSVFSYLSQMNKPDDIDKKIAAKLNTYYLAKSNPLIHRVLKKVASGEELSAIDKQEIKAENASLNAEANLFAGVDPIPSRIEKIEANQRILPNNYNYKELDSLAYTIAKEKSNNNPFHISNHFFNNGLKQEVGNLRGFQKKWSYLSSPEYKDFANLLDLMKQQNLDVQFVIQPTNRLWTNYTGLSQSMLQRFSVNIKKLIHSKGYNKIADYTSRSGENYFMNDTIHMGYRGWVEMDKQVQKFLGK